VTAGAATARIAGEHPEARPWLALVERALAAGRDREWQAAVRASPTPRDPRAPRLAGAAFRLDRGTVRRWLAELAAAAGGRAGDVARVDGLALLEAALTLDGPRLVRLAGEAGGEPAAFRALAEVAGLPLLLAAGRRWAAHVPPTWWEGYCPVCGAWPLLAEDRGVERARRLRCGRCAADWAGEWLRCAFCGTREHGRLGTLVPASGGERRKVETCAACGGYLKCVTTLTGTPAAELLFADVATTDLDVSALAAGYRRPEGAGWPLAVTVAERPGLARRLLGPAA